MSNCYVSLAGSLVGIVTRRAKDLAERRPKNNTLSSTGIIILLVHYNQYCLYKIKRGTISMLWENYNLHVVYDRILVKAILT